MEKFIDHAYAKGQTLIIEGPHLDPVFMVSMIKKYTNQCLPLLMLVEDEQEHI